MKEPTTQFTVSVPKSIADTLKRLADRHGATRAGYTRRVLIDHVKEQKNGKS